MDPIDLVETARSVKSNAYQPYSEYSVGAALLTSDGDVYGGVNIENVTLDMCSHAERTAVKSAITDGHRDFECLAISTEGQDGGPPCGTCRQYLAEFCGDDFKIYSDLGDGNGYDVYRLGDIFPNAFRPQRVEDTVNNNE